MAYGRITLAAFCLAALTWTVGAEVAMAQDFQINDTSWARQYTGPGTASDVAIWLDVDTSGNVFVGGYNRGSGTGFDYTIVKYDSNGTELWVQRYDGPGHSTDSARAFWLDDAGNVYVTGASIGSGTGFDYATLKYDTDGNLLWERRYSLTVQADMANDVFVDGSGNVYVTGHSRGVGTGQDYLTIKYDPAGTEVWQRRFNSFNLELDTARLVAVDDSGNVYVTGTSTQPNKLADIVTLKYDAAGNQQWMKRYNGPGDGFDFPNDMVTTPDKSICITGAEWGAGSRNDIITLMYASDGTLLWNQAYDGTGAWYDQGQVVRVDVSGNVFVAGGSDSPFPYIDDIVTLKYDVSGTNLWVQRYSGPVAGDDAVPYGAQVMPDGSIWVGGYSDSVLIDFTALHYLPNGTLDQTRRFFVTNFSEDLGYDIVVDDAGFIYMTGTTGTPGSTTNYSTVKFMPCACLHQVDVDENGVLDAADLNGLITVAYFSGANLADQGCPVERFDFDCSGFVDSVDFSLLVDYLFFNGTGPCQPCEDL